MERIKKFFQDESGIAMTEYLVLGALIVAGTVVAVTSVGTALTGFFNAMATWIGAHDTFG